MSSRGPSTRSSRRPPGARTTSLSTLGARRRASVGDLVSLATPPEPAVRAVDRKIADTARARGGVFAVDASTEGEAPVLVRRLKDLERVGLVAAEGPGRWKVPPDLVDRLTERARDAPPRHRLFVRKEPLSLKEQVVHQGPVWLDRVEPKTLAGWGLGADVRQAAAERREALRRLGIGPDDPDRIAKLRELERRGLGAEIAARSGRTFLPRVPEGFRGHIEPAEGRDPPGAYAVVSDGARFVVLRATPALRALQGQSVAVVRDAKGRLVVNPTLDKDIGRWGQRGRVQFPLPHATGTILTPADPCRRLLRHRRRRWATRLRCHGRRGIAPGRASRLRRRTLRPATKASSRFVPPR